MDEVDDSDVTEVLDSRVSNLLERAANLSPEREVNSSVMWAAPVETDTDSDAMCL